MTWWEVLIAIPIISMAGVMSAVLFYRWMERNEGKIIRTEADLEAEKFCQQMRGLGQDPVEVMHATAQAIALGVEPWQLKALAQYMCVTDYISEDGIFLKEDK